MAESLGTDSQKENLLDLTFQYDFPKWKIDENGINLGLATRR